MQEKDKDKFAFLEAWCQKALENEWKYCDDADDNVHPNTWIGDRHLEGCWITKYVTKDTVAYNYKWEMEYRSTTVTLEETGDILLIEGMYPSCRWGRNGWEDIPFVSRTKQKK
jgi:hypothetical protein